MQAFTKAMVESGNQRELLGYEKRGHGFFNYGLFKNEMFIATTAEMDNFLVGLGYLDGHERVADFIR